MSYRKAYEIAGIKISNESFTKSEFDIIKRKYPGITLDEAILTFENVETGASLEKFAFRKQRTAKSYRNVYKKFFKKSAGVREVAEGQPLQPSEELATE